MRVGLLVVVLSSVWDVSQSTIHSTVCREGYVRSGAMCTRNLLEKTGNLDKAEPREYVPEEQFPILGEVPGGHRSKRFTKEGIRSKKHITYEVTKYLPSLSRPDVDSVVFLALAALSDSTGITFTKKPISQKHADIEFGFQPPKHINEINLATATYKEHGGVYVAINEDIPWDAPFLLGISRPSLLQALIHEVGHVLGLGYSDRKKAIMLYGHLQETLLSPPQ